MMNRKVADDGAENLKVNDRVLYYSGGYGKAEQDGQFTHVTAVTKTGRFRVKADDERNLYYPDTLKRIEKTQKWSCPAYCVRVNEDSKRAQDRALCRLHIRRLNEINFEECTLEQLEALVGTLNVKGIK